MARSTPSTAMRATTLRLDKNPRLSARRGWVEKEKSSSPAPTMRKRTIIVVMGCMPAARQGLYIGESSELQTTYSAMAAYAMAWLLGTDNKNPSYLPAAAGNGPAENSTT